MRHVRHEGTQSAKVCKARNLANSSFAELAGAIVREIFFEKLCERNKFFSRCHCFKDSKPNS